MMRNKGLYSRILALSFSCLVAGACCTVQAHAQSTHANPAAGGLRYLTPGLPPVMIHPTREASAAAADAKGARGKHGGGGGGTSVNLYYHGGTSGIGVETAPKIYLVLWGSQWNNNDPSGEESLLVNFLGSVGGSSWSNTNTQFCQGVASGTYFCNGGGQAAGNNIVFAGAWYDNTAAAPSHPTQSQIAAEAVKAAAFFGNTAAGSNNTTQYVIATATGNSSSGFGTQYCAYHSYTTSSYGNVAYTNLPYITDAGASCGANFNGLGPDAGITIVEGHEMSETITDQFPSSGWLDSNGAETGDKCAWISSGQGASANVTFPNGKTFPVQSLWSNAFNNNAGGCVLSY
jgi:serine protease